MVVVSCVFVSNCAMESTCGHTVIPKSSSNFHSSDERLTREACDRLSFRQWGVCVSIVVGKPDRQERRYDSLSVVPCAKQKGDGWTVSFGLSRTVTLAMSL